MRPQVLRRTAKLARLEAALLVSDAALCCDGSLRSRLADATEARTLINRLNAAYEAAGTPFRLNGSPPAIGCSRSRNSPSGSASSTSARPSSRNRPLRRSRR